MTCREKLKIEYPECVDERYPAGCRACPDYYGYNNGISRHDCDVIRNNLGCEYCWDQEIIEPKDERDEQIAKLSRMLESKNGLIGTLKEQLKEANAEVTRLSQIELELLAKLYNSEGTVADLKTQLKRSMHLNEVLDDQVKRSLKMINDLLKEFEK